MDGLNPKTIDMRPTTTSDKYYHIAAN